MTELSYKECRHETVSIFKTPCIECQGDPFSKFEPVGQNYGSCGAGRLTEDGNCDVYSAATPCLQWDCGSWSNEPAKNTTDENHDRLMALIKKYARLAELYAASDNADLRCVWFEYVRPAIWGRIEERARAMFGGVKNE